MQDWPVSADKGMHEMSSRAKYLSIRAPLLVTEESVGSIQLTPTDLGRSRRSCGQFRVG